MKIDKILLGAILFFAGQTLAWYQTNGQFISPWIKKHPILMSAIVGLPIGLAYIYGTTYIVEASNGLVWSARIIGFVTGILSFTFLTYWHMDQGVNLKTAVILGLITLVVILQVIWKDEE